MKTVKVALAQINPTVGDIDGNVLKICDFITKAKKQNAAIVVFPELAVTGYPPEDLLLKPQFISDNLDALKRVQRETEGITAVVGFVDRNDGIYNAAAIFHDGKLVDVYHKVYLPNYGVFDEYRYFKAGTKTPVYSIGDIDAYYTTKWYDLGSAPLIKNFVELFLWSDTDTAATMQVYYATDFSSTINSTDITNALSSSLWGTAIWGTGTWAGTSTSLTRVPLSVSGRFIKFKFGEPSIDEPMDLMGYSLLAWGLTYF